MNFAAPVLSWPDSCESGKCLNCSDNCNGKQEPVFVVSSNGERPRAWIYHMFAKFAPPGRMGALPQCVEKRGNTLVIMADALRSMPHTVHEIFDDVAAQNDSGMPLKLTITCVASGAEYPADTFHRRAEMDWVDDDSALRGES